MIDTAHVGFEFPARDSTLSVRRLLAYAAGLGDLSPFVFDDTHPGFMAHPALCTALEWPVISHPAVMDRLVPDAADRLRAVHWIQDSTFHHPLRAGDAVRTTGRVTGIWRGAGGVRSACTLDILDQNGGTRVRTKTVAVYRGVDAVGPDRPPEEAPDTPNPDEGANAAPEAREPSATIEIPIAIEPALPHRYTEGSGIWNPIHTERRVARAGGLPDIVVHGTATWALAGSALVTRFGAGNPARLKRLRGRFGALVFPGSTIALQATAHTDAAGCHVHFRVLTPQGEHAITDGYALLDTTSQDA